MLLRGTISYLYTFPEIIFRNHMSYEKEAILRKSISDERKLGEILETYLKFWWIILKKILILTLKNVKN